ncbi:MAG: dienelactone hydrolase family protein [Gemmatimonadetes bacterium]|nr:dienelactone hydrolase family protein [Gemmatimonadota bacterium]
MLTLALALASALSVQAEGQTLATPDTVVVHNGALALRGLVYRPRGSGPFPAVLFNHGSGPTSEPSKPAALGPLFAGRGYVFLFLFRRGAGLSASQGTNSAELMDRAFADKGQSGRNEKQLELLQTELSDVSAGIAFLRRLPEVDPHRVAAAGHSFGAALTLLLAERDTSLRAAVLFATAAVSWEPSPKLQSRLMSAIDHITSPVFLIHAANDYSTVPGTMLGAEMARLAKPHQVKIYPPLGQTAAEGHGFIYAAPALWEPDVFAFLEKHVQP